MPRGKMDIQPLPTFPSLLVGSSQACTVRVPQEVTDVLKIRHYYTNSVVWWLQLISAFSYCWLGPTFWKVPLTVTGALVTG